MRFREGGKRGHFGELGWGGGGWWRLVVGVGGFVDGQGKGRRVFWVGDSGLFDDC